MLVGPKGPTSYQIQLSCEGFMQGFGAKDAEKRLKTPKAT
jgi:hypothetical protein